MSIYEWDSAAIWGLFAMFAFIKLVFTLPKSVQSLSRSLGEIPMKLRTVTAFWEIRKGQETILYFCV